MILIKNFEEFIDESLQTEELPCVVGGVETDENIQIIDADTGRLECYLIILPV